MVRPHYPDCCYITGPPFSVVRWLSSAIPGVLALSLSAHVPCFFFVDHFLWSLSWPPYSWGMFLFDHGSALWPPRAVLDSGRGQRWVLESTGCFCLWCENSKVDPRYNRAEGGMAKRFQKHSVIFGRKRVCTPGEPLSESLAFYFKGRLEREAGKWDHLPSLVLCLLTLPLNESVSQNANFTDLLQDIMHPRTREPTEKGERLLALREKSDEGRPSPKSDLHPEEGCSQSSGGKDVEPNSLRSCVGTGCPGGKHRLILLM